MRIVLTPKNTNPYLVPLNFVKIKNEKCWYKEGIQAAVRKSKVPCTRKGYVFFLPKERIHTACFVPTPKKNYL